MCFVWIWEQTAIISLYSINWLVCITETEFVYCAVRTECLYVIQVPLKSSGHYMYHQVWSLYVPPSLTLKNSTLCPHSVFMCSVWISEQTAIISLYSINWLIFITETECVYCAVRTECLYAIQAPLKPSGHYMYHQVSHSQILPSTETVYLCVLCGSQNKQRLFPCTALTDWFYNRNGACLLRGTDWIFVYNAVSF